MIKSMTGYGRARAVINGREIIAELRSVNHKFFELNIKLGRAYGFLEPELKALLKQKISRGKLELSLTVYNLDTPDAEVTVNKSAVNSYIFAAREAAQELGIGGDFSITDLFRIPDAFTVIKSESGEQQVKDDIFAVVNEAVDKFIEMRVTEGESLKADVLEKAANIERMTKLVEQYSPESAAAYRTRLYDKIKEVLEGKDIDEQRILTEAAIFAEKIAVDEETVRLHSHISQLRRMLDGDGEIGRKLDFLVQEMNRETNTIGSKSADIRITELVVDMKSEIEKIREQIQNIE
ncbi:MAG: YicC family protein [Eubacterium sp.]|nr:YicC family protein [Eubacterium sp.]